MSKLQGFARFITEALTLYHTSDHVFPQHKPDFDAYYGTAAFLKAFPHEFGAHTYAVDIPSSMHVLVLDVDSSTTRRFFAALAALAWPADTAFAAAVLRGEGDDSIYEAWTNKTFVMRVLNTTDFRSFDLVQYREEYVIPARTLAKLTGRKID